MTGDLIERHKTEQAFHDEWAKQIDLAKLDSEFLATCPTTPETSYALSLVGDVTGKRILDLGCGPCELSVWFARRCSKVVAVDISMGMLQIGQRLLQTTLSSEEQGSVFCVQASGEYLPFCSESFDVVFGHDVLHHLDLEITKPEINRVLRFGGKAVFVEPLADNPIISLFREKTPNVRTPYEAPLTMESVRGICQSYNGASHQEFQLCTLAIMFWFWVCEIGEKSHRKTRYWKKLITEAEKYKWPFRALYAMDRTLFKLFPFMRRFARMTVIYVVKNRETVH